MYESRTWPASGSFGLSLRPCLLTCILLIKHFLRRIMVSRRLRSGPLPASANESRQGQKKMPPVFSPSFSELFKLFSFCFSKALGKSCKDHVSKELRSEVPQ